MGGGRRLQIAVTVWQRDRVGWARPGTPPMASGRGAGKRVGGGHHQRVRVGSWRCRNGCGTNEQWSSVWICNWKWDRASSLSVSPSFVIAGLGNAVNSHMYLTGTPPLDQRQLPLVRRRGNNRCGDDILPSTHLQSRRFARPG